MLYFMNAHHILTEVSDFEVDGAGANPAWEKTDWLNLQSIQPGPAPATKAKILTSSTGIYFLVFCEDNQITCTHTSDNADLFKEDVVEVFLQPCARLPVYFEYEISPLGFELPLLVSNSGKGFHGWLPWKNSGARATRRATTVYGGEKEPGASCSAWSAEFVIPFALLHGMVGTPPSPGDRWKANLYRIDYDNDSSRHYAWEPATGTNFHSTSNFGMLEFPKEL